MKKETNKLAFPLFMFIIIAVAYFLAFHFERNENKKLKNEIKILKMK